MKFVGARDAEAVLVQSPSMFRAAREDPDVLALAGQMRGVQAADGAAADDGDAFGHGDPIAPGLAAGKRAGW
jgi:hypothetical protein